MTKVEVLMDKIISSEFLQAKLHITIFIIVCKIPLKIFYTSWPSNHILMHLLEFVIVFRY